MQSVSGGLRLELLLSQSGFSHLFSLGMHGILVSVWSDQTVVS